MKFFETVNRFLENQVPILAEDLGISLGELYQQMANHLDTMANEWRSGKQPSIDYQDPVCRLAYIFRHVPINANLFLQALSEYFVDPAKSQITCLGEVVQTHINESGQFQVCAFGGGPGTELLALAKYFSLHPLTRANSEVNLVILDRVAEWGDSWLGLREAIKEQFDSLVGPPFGLQSIVIPFDMTDMDSYQTARRSFRSDLFVLNHIVSEVYDEAGLLRLTEVLSAMRSRAPTGAAFALLDRNDDRTRRAVDDVLSQAGLIKVHETDVSGVMDSDEQMDVLADHISAMNQRPRVRWGDSGAFFVIAGP